MWLVWTAKRPGALEGRGGSRPFWCLPKGGQGRGSGRAGHPLKLGRAGLGRWKPDGGLSGQWGLHSILSQLGPAPTSRSGWRGPGLPGPEPSLAGAPRGCEHDGTREWPPGSSLPDAGSRIGWETLPEGGEAWLHPVLVSGDSEPVAPLPASLGEKDAGTREPSETGVQAIGKLTDEVKTWKLGPWGQCWEGQGWRRWEGRRVGTAGVPRAASGMGGRVKHPLDVNTSLNLHVSLMALPCSLPPFPSLREENSC